MPCCPNCAHVFAEPDPPSDDPQGVPQITLLKHECRARGIAVTYDGHLDPIAAARFLGLSVKRLANMRSELDGPQWRRDGRRVEYPLEALGGWRDGRRKKSSD